MASLPIVVFTSCSSTPSEINDILNSLQDTLANVTYSDEILAKQKSNEAAASIVDDKNNISSNIINASIFSQYPWNQMLGKNFVTQLQPISAKSEGTTVILRVRIAYFYNNDLNTEYYSDYKNLIVQFYIPAK